MTAEIITFSRHAGKVNIPVFITHDQENRHVSIPQGLRYRRHDESWMDYCQRLWIGVYENNGRDDIGLTVHLKLSEMHRVLYELNQWVFYARSIDNGALSDLVEERVAGLSIHNVKFKADVAE